MAYIFYEKAADEKNYLYYVNLKDMDLIRYKFFGTHIHKSIEVVVCYNSKMEYKINDKVGTFKSGEILLVNSFDSHFYKSIDNASAYIFVFSLDLIEGIELSNLYEFNNVISLSESEWKEIKEFIDDSFPKLESYTYLQKKSFALMFFGLLEKTGKLIRKKEYVADRNIGTQILQYINDNYQKELTLPEVSKVFGYNTNYFSSLFNKVIGVSFIEYLNSFRMEKVIELKKNPNYAHKSINELTKLCGFSNSEKYYRMVRKLKQRKKEEI